MLYKRNYLELTNFEKKRIENAKIYYTKIKAKNGLALNAKQLEKYHRLLPYVSYQHNSLFPNNYILFNYKKHLQNLEYLYNDFEKLIKNTDSNERDILNFISENECYFILESLFFRYDFGHHSAYLFREFELPPNYIVDFLLVGKSSGGYEFVFIEFESPNKEITLKDGSLGSGFRKGLQQIDDWDSWLDSNYLTLKNNFKKFKNPNKDLPSEFYELDKSRMTWDR